MEDKRKILITEGMSHDAMLFITDAPKEVIEDFCRKTNKDIEDGVGNGYNFLIEKDYYIKELHNSLTDLSDNIDIIGFNEVYDLFNYQDATIDKEEDSDYITVEITLERTQRISNQVKVTKEQLQMLESGENPFQEEMEKYLDDNMNEYDYAVYDLEGNTLVDWQ